MLPPISSCSLQVGKYTPRCSTITIYLVLSSQKVTLSGTHPSAENSKGQRQPDLTRSYSSQLQGVFRFALNCRKPTGENLPSSSIWSSSAESQNTAVSLVLHRTSKHQCRICLSRADRQSTCR